MRTSLASRSTLALAMLAAGLAGTGTSDAAETLSSSVNQIVAPDTVLAGQITGGHVTADSLMVGVKQGNWRQLPEGSSFDIYRLPTSDIAVTDDTWVVTLDPTAVPDRFVAPDGQVDFIIEAHDTATPAAAFQTVSAVRVTQTIGTASGWLRSGAAIPAGWKTLPGLSASTASTNTTTAASAPQLGTSVPGSDDREATDASVNASSVNAGELTGIPLELIKAPSAAATDEDATDTSVIGTKPAAAEVSMKSSAPWNCTEIAGYRYNIQTTIGTGYPVGGDASSLTYSSSMKTTSGSATSYGGWHESGTETTTDGWGADFLKDTRRRSYRTDVTYGYYSCYNAAGYSTRWIFPIKQPGSAYYYYLSSAPNWTHCAPVYNNVIWRRDNSKETDYSLSYGVKSKDYIGFEMYSRHGYSSGAALRYHVTHGNKHVCGNNTSPGDAGKVQEKY